MKKRTIALVLGTLVTIALVLAFALAPAAPAGADNPAVPFNNPNYIYRQLTVVPSGNNGVRWPDYSAIAGKVTWYEQGYLGYFADFNPQTLTISNTTPLNPTDDDVYVPTFSKDGQYIFFQGDRKMTRLTVSGGTIDAYLCYRYNIATGQTETIFDISTIPATTIEALTGYVGDEFGFYLSPTESNDAVLMGIYDARPEMEIVRYEITTKTFQNLTNSAQAEYDGRYFGTDTNKLLYWTESHPGHNIR
ncbi:MAG: hypothetical protein N3E40_04590, partial [Dehalococcoidia bacterium]|nr:hypothetical protein [Dehalococcoidia bacterium]